MSGRWKAALGAAACAAGAVLLAGSLLRASMPPRLPEVPLDAGPATERTRAGESIPLSRLMEAAERNPFHPERRRATARYRLPGEPVPHAATEHVPHPPPDAHVHGAPLRLLGTGSRTDGQGFAVVERLGGPSRLVRVGETFEGYRLRSVARRSARLVGPDGSMLEINVSTDGT
jgi:hypothetical protein